MQKNRYLLLKKLKKYPKCPPLQAITANLSRRPRGRKQSENVFLKIIPIGIPTYAGMKTGFHADIGPRNRFSCQRIGRNADK